MADIGGGTWASRLSEAAPAVARPGELTRPGAAALTRGFVMYLSLIVLVPRRVGARRMGMGQFLARSPTRPRSRLSKLTLLASAVVVILNAVFGTLIAWVMIRDDFRGKSIVNSIIDLPFALPTIVAGLTLLALYGPRGPTGINVAYTKAAVILALLFVTLPFVVRAVQPVLIEARPRDGGGRRLFGGGELHYLSPDHRAQPDARYFGRRGSRVRACCG